MDCFTVWGMSSGSGMGNTNSFDGASSSDIFSPLKEERASFVAGINQHKLYEANSQHRRM